MEEDESRRTSSSSFTQSTGLAMIGAHSCPCGISTRECIGSDRKICRQHLRLVCTSSLNRSALLSTLSYGESNEAIRHNRSVQSLPALPSIQYNFDLRSALPAPNHALGITSFAASANSPSLARTILFGFSSSIRLRFVHFLLFRVRNLRFGWSFFYFLSFFFANLIVRIV